MATKEQLIEAFKAAADSGDEASARAFAHELQRLAVETKAQTPAIEPPPLGARVGRGAQDFIDRLSQLSINAGEKMGLVAPGIGDLATKAMKEDADRYERERQSDPNAGFDAARLTGNVGMMSPLALGGGSTSLLGRIGTGARAGAVGGALAFDPENSVAGTLKNTAAGAAGGAILGPIAGYVGDKGAQFGRFLIGRIRGASAAAKPLEVEAERILQQVAPTLGKAKLDTLVKESIAEIKRTGTLDTEALARKANLIANDLTPTKASVTRNPADWSAERNLQKLAQSTDEELSGVGRELTSVYQGNDRALATRLGQIGKDLPAGSTEQLGGTVMKSLDDLAKASQADVGKLYRQVAETKGEQLASDARQLTDTLENLRDNTYAEKLVGSVTNKLKRFGMLDAEGKLTAKTLTVSQAEELRKFVNTLPNDFGKKDIIRAIDADVMGGLGEDAFGGARAAAQERFKMLFNPATQKALSTLGELSEGKTAQNFIQAQVVGGSEKDVAALVDTIGKMDTQAGQQALGAMRSGVMQHLTSKAVDDKSGKFSGAAFDKALKQIGDAKLIKIFGPEVTDQLKSLSKAAIDATFEPPYSAVNHSGTAPMLLSLIRGARATVGLPLPGLNEVTEKAVERSAARGQLGKVLEAVPESQLPTVPALDEIATLIGRSAAPAVPATLDAKRKQANQNR